MATPGNYPPGYASGTKWCFVNDGYNCAKAFSSWDASEERKWLPCSNRFYLPQPCQCQRSWIWYRPPGHAGPATRTMLGCSTTPDGAYANVTSSLGTPWCYVQSNACSSALAPSTAAVALR